MKLNQLQCLLIFVLVNSLCTSSQPSPSVISLVPALPPIPPAVSDLEHLVTCPTRPMTRPLCPNGVVHVLSAVRFNCRLHEGRACCTQTKKCGQLPAFDFLWKVVGDKNVHYTGGDLSASCNRRECSCANTLDASYRCVSYEEIVDVANSSSSAVSFPSGTAYLLLDKSSHQLHCLLDALGGLSITLLRAHIPKVASLHMRTADDDWVEVGNSSTEQWLLHDPNHEPLSADFNTSLLTLQTRGNWTHGFFFLFVEAQGALTVQCGAHVSKQQSGDFKKSFSATALAASLTTLIVLVVCLIVFLLLWKRKLFCFKKVNTRSRSEQYKHEPRAYSHATSAATDNLGYTCAEEVEQYYSEIDLTEKRHQRKRSTLYEIVIPSPETDEIFTIPNSESKVPFKQLDTSLTALPEISKSNVGLPSLSAVQSQSSSARSTPMPAVKAPVKGNGSVTGGNVYLSLTPRDSGSDYTQLSECDDGPSAAEISAGALSTNKVLTQKQLFEQKPSTPSSSCSPRLPASLKVEVNSLYEAKSPLSSTGSASVLPDALYVQGNDLYKSSDERVRNE